MRRRTRVALRLAAAAIVAVAFPGAARTEYVGPNTGAKSVQQILAAPIDGQIVDVRGYLIRKTAPQLFVLQDSTGEITVEIQAKIMPRAQVRPDTPVEIQGVVETGWRKGPRIEASDVIVLPPAKAGGS
jgi:uncharacterized protein (TIGR00156 family)